MSTQNETQIKIKSGFFITTPVFERGRDRFRVTSPEELSRRMRIDRGEEILVTIRRTDPIEIPLPYHLVLFIKDLIFNKRAQEEDVKEEVGFMVYEYINPLLRVLGIGPNTITIFYRGPEEFELKIERDKEFNVDVAILQVSGFTILPLEKPSNYVKLYGRILNKENDYDLSFLRITIDLYNLLKELKIRWDVSTG